ncbi:MAG: hypothetical protein JW788_00400 [Candidatus Omnitrophica bacterium]|nr:hypothetical protein [Candidatus Omnitrophota bacterium]
MLNLNFKKNKEGAVSFKFYILPALLIFSLVLSLGLNQIYKSERNSLLQKLNELGQINSELNNKLKAILKSRSDMDAYRRPKLSGAEKPVPGGSFVSSAPLEGKRRDTESSLMRLKDYMKSLQEQRDSQQESLSQMSVLLDSKEKEIARLNGDNLSLKTGLEKAVADNNKLKIEFESSIGNLRAQLSQKEYELVGMVLKLEDENRDLKERFKATSEANIGLRKELAEGIAGVDLRLSEANKRVTELTGVNSYLEKQASVFRQEKLQLEESLKTLKSELRSQESANVSLNKKVDDLEYRLGKSQKENAAIKEELAGLLTAKKSLSLELEELKVLRDGNERRIGQLQAQIKDLSQSRDSLKEDYGMLSEIINKKESELKSAKNELARVNEVLIKNSNERGTLLIAMKEKEEGMLKINSELEGMKLKLDSLKAELAVSEESRGNIERELEKLNASKAALEDKLSNISMELALLRAEKNKN